MTGRVLEIRRLAVHDGPGIRTTLFLKGCPLRCRWCHNPEGVLSQPEIGFHRRRCSGCGRCVSACPRGAQVCAGGVRHFRRERCRVCGRCVAACLPGALEYYGRSLSVAAASAAVLEDRTFYAMSGGGCTLSGGEPLAQVAFCAALLRRLHPQGIHCAIDTSGAVPWQSLATVLPYTDLFLYDVKHVDEGLHRRHTGSPNRRILANLRRLAASAVPVEVRIPLIPGFNADADSLGAIGAWLSRLPNLQGVRLLPYHLARSKYATVGHADTMPAVAPPAADALVRAADLLRHGGVARVLLP